MVNRIKASNPGGLNKGCGLKVCVGSRVRQETPEEGQGTYLWKRSGYDNKDEGNSPKTLNEKKNILISS